MHIIFMFQTNKLHSTSSKRGSCSFIHTREKRLIYVLCCNKHLFICHYGLFCFVTCDYA
jgi:hypothetical protein